MKRVSKQEAASALGVSTATIDRMIKRGDLDAEREGHGDKGHRVWILLEDTSAGDEAPVAAGVDAGVASGEESHEVLLERVRSLEELVSYQRKLLTDADWRYQLLVENMPALPAPRAEDHPSNGNGHGGDGKRFWWWPFQKR